VLKFLRDPGRMLSTFIFPLMFIAVLGGSLQANLGTGVSYNFIAFTFAGVLAQTLFQSTALGIISLIEDRENDFSQEIFVSPISRYTIVFGKIMGETSVSVFQGVAVILIGIVVGVPMTVSQVLAQLPVAFIVCLFGGAFGVIVLSTMSSQRAANQIFPLIMFPQLFLAGVFAPIKVLPWYLDILSRISPLRYAVDLARGVFFLGQPEFPQVILIPPLTNLVIIAILFAIFLIAGTLLFVRSESNR
jgi:ABC-2 type transport system permease protein